MILFNLYRFIRVAIFCRCKYILILALLSITACTNNPFVIDTSQINISFELLRFDNDVFKKSLYEADDFQKMRNTYGTFFDMYLENIIRIKGENDSLTVNNLNSFLNDSDIQRIRQETNTVHSNFDITEEKLHHALLHYAHYFPDKIIPRVVTYISAFNYQTVATDSVLGIGLDMYLGADCSFYPSIGIPSFISRKLSYEYIPTDAMRGWLQTEYTEDSLPFQLLPRMIYLGKIQYALRSLLPQEHDTLLFGYTQDQLLWTVENENKIWSYLIENKWLYNNQPSEYFKFISDAASTQGLPKESPGKIAAYIGWRIVSSYMGSNKSVSLSQLMNDNDAQKILSASNYKPSK